MNKKNRSYQKAYKNFLARLTQARKQTGLTQVEVATRLGKPHSLVSKCELGERRVDFVELQQFAMIYGKELTFFSE